MHELKVTTSALSGIPDTYLILNIGKPGFERYPQWSSVMTLRRASCSATSDEAIARWLPSEQSMTRWF